MGRVHRRNKPIATAENRGALPQDLFSALGLPALANMPPYAADLRTALVYGRFQSRIRPISDLPLRSKGSYSL